MSDINVTLDIRNSQSQPGQGWRTVTAANGQQYSYKYSGGSDGNGDVNVNTPDQRIVVDLICDTRYSVDSVALTDPKHDVTETHTARQVIFVDSDADKGYDIYYGINIRDTTAATTFRCDPEIHNEQQG